MINNIDELLLINKKYYKLIWHYEKDDNMYIYLINKDNYSDIIFAKLCDNNEIEIIKDQNELADIIGFMAKEVNTFVV